MFDVSQVMFEELSLNSSIAWPFYLKDLNNMN